MFKEIMLIAAGTIFGIMAMLFVQYLQTSEMKKNLHRKLFEEIKDNSRLGTAMELTGNFKRFEVSAWDNFVGTAAFYDVPIGIRRPLDSYYMILKWNNEGMLKWKKLEEKEKEELKIKELINLTDPYIKFIFDKKILRAEYFTDSKLR